MTDRLIGLLTRVLNATDKSRHIISITKQLGLRLLVRGLPMWILYSLWISWISIFSRRRTWVDFVDFVDFDFQADPKEIASPLFYADLLTRAGRALSDEIKMLYVSHHDRTTTRRRKDEEADSVFF